MILVTYSISVLLMVILPVILAALLRRRFRVPWMLFGIGTLTFIGSQVVHLPLNNLLTKIGLLPQNATEGPELVRMLVIMGLTAGICEELARTAGYALLKRYRKFEDSLMLGLGHGGIESMVFGGVLTAATISSLYSLRGTDLSELGLPAEQLAAITTQMELFTSSAWTGFSPLLERGIAIFLHITLSVIVWKAFERRNAWYVVLAILYHAAVDGLGVYVAIKTMNFLAIEATFLVGLLPGLVWLWIMWKKKKANASHPSFPISADWKLFGAALKKELFQMWRTKRFLILAAVFGVFGLISPLLAYFMPELLGSIEGAEMFADLIPEPTISDAMEQYVKNITQFGFVLAILFGMGAVAGEKERGTAAMILSKPMPRWVFVTSKFFAQGVGYAVAFLIATLGAYLYTVVLFGQFPFLRFLGMNALLFLWLMTFVGAALLGSTIANNFGAAAGIGFGGAVFLLLMGSFPQVGALFPAGLMAWAGQLGDVVSESQIAPNFGAVAAVFVIVLMCNLWSIAVFEQQEL